MSFNKNKIEMNCLGNWAQYFSAFCLFYKKNSFDRTVIFDLAQTVTHNSFSSLEMETWI